MTKTTTIRYSKLIVLVTSLKNQAGAADPPDATPAGT
jgi:hypothetical protein